MCGSGVLCIRLLHYIIHYLRRSLRFPSSTCFVIQFDIAIELALCMFVVLFFSVYWWKTMDFNKISKLVGYNC